MLLSRQGFPALDLGESGVPPAAIAGAVAAIAQRLPSEPPRGELGASPPLGVGGSEITPLNWSGMGPRGAVAIVDGGSGATVATITVEYEYESGGSGSNSDWSASSDPAGGEGEAFPVDVPDTIGSPDDDNLAEGIIYEGLDGLDAIPWQADYTIDGSLDASQSHIAYRIPVGPGTGRLHLAIYSERIGPGPPPQFDKLYIVDSAGIILAKITSASIGDEGSRLTVTLQGAPEGSQLVVGLAMGDPQVHAEPEAGAEPDGGFDGEPPPPPPPPSITFELNIQRDDPAPPSTPGEPSGPPVITMPGTIPPTTTPPPAQDGRGAIGWTSFQSARLILDGLIRVERGWSVGGRASTSALSWTEMGRSAGGRVPSVYLGPLVSRGAAPLGPTLATPTDESTLVIDRERLAVDEALDRIGAELDSGPLAGLKHRDDSDSGGTRAIPGAGGMPILVTAPTRAPGRADAEALTANLQSRSVEEALSAEAPKAPTTTEPGADDVRIASAGMITRAAGLVIGLGLATGPLYPDLVLLARRKLARGNGRFLKRRWFFRGRPARPAF